MKFKLASLSLITIMSIGTFANASPTIYFTGSKNFPEIETKEQFIDVYKSQVHQFTTMESLRDSAQDDPKASFLMSKMHYYGVYFDQNDEKALSYAMRAADKGLPSADLWYRALRLEHGVFIPMTEWREDAFQGDPMAQYVVALSYLDPEYLVQKDIAFLMDPMGSNENIAGKIKIDPNPFMDYDIALFLLARSGSSGYEPAQKLRRGILEEQSAQTSLEQRRKEAREGGLEGLRLLREAYSQGQIVEPNIRKAVVLKQFIADYERNDHE